MFPTGVPSLMNSTGTLTTNQACLIWTNSPPTGVSSLRARLIRCNSYYWLAAEFDSLRLRPQSVDLILHYSRIHSYDLFLQLGRWILSIFIHKLLNNCDAHLASSDCYSEYGTLLRSCFPHQLHEDWVWTLSIRPFTEDSYKFCQSYGIGWHLKFSSQWCKSFHRIYLILEVPVQNGNENF